MAVFKRTSFLAAVFLALALALGTAAGLPGRVDAGCGSDVTWTTSSSSFERQTSDTANGQTTTTQQWSSTSEQHSDDGQDFNDQQSRTVNPDGSSSEHEQTDYSDSTGNGCYSDGEPWSGHASTDTETDPKGNRKEHHEELIEKNGKCEKYVRDREWDSKGKLIKDVESTTEVPCKKFDLEYSREGNISSGGINVHWGPNKALIPVGLKNGVYEGSYEGAFDAKISGKCNGAYTYPVTVKLTAKEDEFHDLEFTVTTTMSMAGTLSCPGGGGPVGNAPVTFTRTFTIPDEDGATKTYDIPMASSGQTTDTYVLKKPNS
jgi:hypothetical protein